MSDIAEAVTEHISRVCQCQYSNDFVIDGQLLCTDDDTAVIYQAMFLTSDERSALEIRNISQLWVLSKPMVSIDGQSYEVDPYCLVTVTRVGESSCNTAVSTEALSSSHTRITLIEMVSISGTGLMLLLVILLIIILACRCSCKKKSMSYDVR